jgi:hypothetical protein
LLKDFAPDADITSEMRRVLHSLTLSYGDESTAAFRRVFLSLLLGAAAGLFLIARLQPILHATTEQIAGCISGMGFLAMLVAALIEISGTLWAKGVFGKVLASCLFGVGTFGIILLVSFAAAVALGS